MVIGSLVGCAEPARQQKSGSWWGETPAPRRESRLANAAGRARPVRARRRASDRLNLRFVARASAREEAMRPVVVAVAITGSVPRKKDNPALPTTPAEQIESTHQAFEAGATIA